tara:strand:- start:223 stop:1284 length:1062 start_codon:yes stop_codon:yes gene_type:complete
VINQKKQLVLIKKFIKNSNKFWNDHNIKNLDLKHKKILKNFSHRYRQDIKLFSDEIIDWESQSNLGAPFQLSLKKIKYSSLRKILSIFKGLSIQNYFNKMSFFDDLEIIKKNKGLAIIKDSPVHLSLGSTESFFLEKNISTNNRWNRYVYIASQIRNRKLLSNKSKNWLDIGSFYGGLQAILKKYYKNQNFYLLDFNHQLCRSFIVLNKLYPDANHVLPNQKKKIRNNKNNFFYIPVQNIKDIENIKFDLITNFFSFGEMSRPFFNYYFKKKFINNSKIMYFVNRFVSSPWFEPTYKNDLNIFDYENKNFKTNFFDIFPIHHYKNVKRNLFGRNSYRPISSPYFEKIMINKKY